CRILSLSLSPYTTLFRSPLVVAPAMHTEMWQNPATEANVATLRARGVHIVGPASGQLTGSDSGPGRMAEPVEIAEAALATLRPRSEEHTSELQSRENLVC